MKNHFFYPLFRKIFLFGILVIFSATVFGQSFVTTQKQYKRVREAYNTKDSVVKQLCKDKNVDFDRLNIHVIAYKAEEKLEIWGKTSTDTRYILLKTYDFCSTSGDLGPKREMGDMQIPEGFYHIDRFNAWSSFYLSLGTSYPNKSDKKRGEQNPGGDIFIHGDCCTIGCIPLTDNLIKEVYVMAVQAKNTGQNKVKVWFFPYRMTPDNNTAYFAKNEYKKHISFWKELQPAYDYFIENKRLPSITILNSGAYSVLK